MTKVRKVKRRKKYRVNINRKRLRNKLRKLPTIECKQIKQAWEVTKSTRSNLGEMGLAYDPNEVLQIPNKKRELVEDAKLKVICDAYNSKSEHDDEGETNVFPKIHVAESLEADAKLPRKRTFRLPKGHVQFLTYLMDKYKEDYKAMAFDKKNYDQLTWKQIRAKIKILKGIPEQYNEYLHQKNIS